MKSFYKAAVWREIWFWFKVDLKSMLIFLGLAVLVIMFISVTLLISCGKIDPFLQSVFLKAILVLMIWEIFYLSICFVMDLVSANKKIKGTR